MVRPPSPLSEIAVAHRRSYRAAGVSGKLAAAIPWTRRFDREGVDEIFQASLAQNRSCYRITGLCQILSCGQLDLALHRSFKFTDTRVTEFRLETFNTFNHTLFFGPVAVKADIDSPLLTQAVRAASPRLLEAALKFAF